MTRLHRDAPQLADCRAQRNPDTEAKLLIHIHKADGVFTGGDGKGLEGVVATTSIICYIDGDRGILAVDVKIARFDRDVLSQTGATHVIVLEGINDLRGFAGPGSARQPVPTAAEVTAGYLQIIARAHAHGLVVYGATLTPNAWVGGPMMKIVAEFEQSQRNYSDIDNIYEKKLR